MQAERCAEVVGHLLKIFEGFKEGYFVCHEALAEFLIGDDWLKISEPLPRTQKEREDRARWLKRSLPTAEQLTFKGSVPISSRSTKKTARL